MLTYAAAIFLSAFLLFSIQPLVSKRILPWFGGSAAVWTTCLLFFQSFLFAGYAYAHGSHARLKPRQQALIHGALIIAAILFLRPMPSERWEPTGAEQPITQILLILSLSVGVPYFVLSATGPLLQAWFAQSFPGRVPYRLYALSNAGSLLALLSYPFVFEPTLDLSSQAKLWAFGFVAFAGLCGYIAWRIASPQSSASAIESGNKADKKRSAAAATDEPAPEAARPHPALYAFWLLMATCGSIVLMATTNHITVDVAVMPLLWVVPLAIYLLTYIIAFDRPAWYRRTPFAIAALLCIYAAAMMHHLEVGTAEWRNAGTPGILYWTFSDPAAPSPKLHLSTVHFMFANFATLFAICMICHGELARMRPAPRYLTSFYLMIAAGGALGGIFVALIAPLLFETYWEWDAMLVAACLGSMGIVGWSAIRRLNRNRNHEHRPSRYALLAAIVFVFFLTCVIFLKDLSECLFARGKNVRWRARNFFGALSIREVDPQDESSRRFMLVHGTITHGTQFVAESRRRQPTTYFGRISGAGRAIDLYQKELPPGKLRIAAVGLGAGTFAAYPEAGESITFYEINPIVIDVAERSQWFTYIRDCRRRGAHCDIRLGDARLTLHRELQQQQVQPYHLILLDAFSGDSIPVHLLTVEAFETYLAMLTQSTSAADALGQMDEGGTIAVHISNKYLDLEPVVRALALRFGLIALKIPNLDDDPSDVYRADWIILTHNRAAANKLAKYSKPFIFDTRPLLWTDARSSVFEILK